jgi:hypothetical protein
VNKFKIAITDANLENRKLINEENKAISHIVSEMQKEKARCDEEFA